MRTVSIRLSDGHYEIAPDNGEKIREWQEHEKRSNELWQSYLAANTIGRVQAAADYLAESKAYWGEDCFSKAETPI